ncbi:unnamed protein product [Owenia fusiformis]|uniref:Uncharacterized protein n=1 Tax=Owenia fusiformis TaxID=6347 RepID=A0A8J1T6H0_OWEFU|nr:unnamed protein product [Owenia fusiformis]
MPGKGLRKAKKYDWKDSNLALFGSDLEKNVKKTSASGEQAWSTVDKNRESALYIWRIVKFGITEWPAEDYGSFFDGDSYIILNQYKKEDSDEIEYDVHFWIGKYSTQDEYGTAAYKTVELDTFLDDKPVQHREVMGHESELFLSYFDEIRYLKGGAASGFRHVKAEEYEPRLLHFHGKGRKVIVKEVARTRKNLKSDDVYILDLGLKIIQWNGEGSNKDERFKAVQFLQKLKGERGGKADTQNLDEARLNPEHLFYKSIPEEDDDDDDDDETDAADNEKKLMQLSDQSGNVQFNVKKTGDVTSADFDTKDVFMFDTTQDLFVWVGLGASAQEKKSAMMYAHKYLAKSPKPYLPVTVLREGQYNLSFKTALAA